MTAASLAASEEFQNHCLNPTAATTTYWEQWLKQHPEHQATFEEARTIVLSLSLEPSEAEIKAAFSDFKVAVENRQGENTTKLVAISNHRKPENSRRKFIAAAATIAIILAIGWWQYFLVPANETIQLATNFGEVKTYILPDGSKVILNANSSLSFKKQWTSQNPRAVDLEGEALFEVVKKSEKEPFVVQTAEGTIQVLGTSFNVKQRATAFEVALLEGVVALSIPEYPTIKMNPGELVRVNGPDFYERNTADVDAFSAWRFQRMVFKEMSIAKVIQRLQEEFDWTVKVADEVLLKRKITATIPKNDPELLLKALSEIYDLKIEQVAEKAYLIK